MTVCEMLGVYGVVPVVRLEDAKDAVPLAQALDAGGLPVAEITFRTAAAVEAIRQIARRFPHILVGAGTVTQARQVDEALDAGARYIVCPGYDENLVRYCLQKEVPVLPGVTSPSEIQRACGLGLSLLKFFPASLNGGGEMLKAFAGPFAEVRFIPTGGVSEGNLAEYLAHKNVAACGGTWMAPPNLIAQGRFEEITAIAARTMGIVLGLQLAHVGMNCADADAAAQCADFFGALAAQPVKAGENSVFAGAFVEAMKRPGRGAHGHIGLSAANPERAYQLLKLRGYAFIEESIVYDAAGHVKAAYLQNEAEGFAIHLMGRG